MHNVTNKREDIKGQQNKARGKNEDQTSKPMRAATETEHWVVIGDTMTQEIQREKVNHSLEFQNLHNNQVRNQNPCEEHHQDSQLDHPIANARHLVVLDRGGK